jgi:DNA-binding NarL/FixJ family response regulator
MTDGQIWALMLRRKVFTASQILEDAKPPAPIRGYIKEKIRSLIVSQVKNRILKVIDNDIPVFATSDATEEDIEKAKRTCPICQTKFFPKESVQEFCSAQCRAEHYRRYHEKRRRKIGMAVGSKRRWSKEDIEHLENLLRMGFTYDEIAERLNRTKTAVIEKVKQIKGVRK